MPRYLSAILIICMALILSGCETPLFTLKWAPVDLSNPRAHNPSKILAADGSLIGLMQINRHEPVTREQIPEQMVAALTAAEDRRFFEHDGIDVRGIARAVFANQKEGKVVQGGSTITQQLIKNQYLDARDKTISRKALEANMAMKLEEQKTKDEILTDYFNTVYLGSGAYGIQAGATTYFRKPLSELSLDQIALLIGILRRPEGANPYTNPEGAIQERRRVLAAMRDVGHIDEPTFQAADSTPLIVQPKPEGSPHRYPGIMESVRRQLVNSGLLGWGEEDTMNRLFSNGYTIQTTINPAMQDAAQRGATAHLSGDEPEAAIVLIDPSNGQVRAMVGGRDPAHNQFNLATQGRRQPGSVFKVFGLAAALESGMPLTQTFDAGPGEITLENGEAWSFKSAQPAGPMSIEDGLVVSSNGVYARLGMHIGGQQVTTMAQTLGVSTPQSANASNILGGIDPGVTTYEMANAFATLANHGVRNEPVLVTSVVDAFGNELLPPPAPGQQVVAASTADSITKVMERVIIEGTGKAASIGRPAAGKTGTVNNNTDAWFVGYTPNLVGAVWVGYPNELKPMNIKGFGTVQGGNLPATIWALTMKEALANTPAVPFTSASAPAITPAPSTTPTPSESAVAQPSASNDVWGHAEASPSAPTAIQPAPSVAPVPTYTPYRPEPILGPQLPQEPPRPQRPTAPIPPPAPSVAPSSPVQPSLPPSQAPTPLPSQGQEVSSGQKGSNLETSKEN